MNSEKKVSRARAILCTVLCVVFAVLTTYQFCFYTIFNNYQQSLTDTKNGLQATIDEKNAENEALRATVAELEGEVAALTAHIVSLTGKPDGDAEDCLRHLLRLGLKEHGVSASVTGSASIDAVVDDYMATYADDALDVASRLLFVDFLYRENYYGTAPDYEAAQEAMIEGYIKAAHDLYAHYYTADEYAEFLDKMNASVSGIGAVTGYHAAGRYLLILHTHKNSPAARAGLLPFDRIVEVDGKTFSSAEEATALIGGEEGSTVFITAERDGVRTTYPITRAKVTADTVISRVYEEDGKTVGYLRIVSFNNLTCMQFEEAYEALTDAGATSLVLDLRDNTGGTVQSALDLLDRILDKGLPLVSYDYKNEHNQPEPVLSKDDGLAVDLPIVLLINRETASAAEIFTAALRGNNRVTLIGEKTLGKGVIQTRHPLGDGSYVYATVAAYLSPAFGSYTGMGKIPPDIAVSVAAGYEATRIYILPEFADLPLARALSEAATRSVQH